MPETKKRQTRPTPKTCKQMTELVFDYLHDNLSSAVRRDFQRHLRICPDCVSFLNTYRKTISATRALRPEEIPPRLRNTILEFLRSRLRKRAVRS